MTEPRVIVDTSVWVDFFNRPEGEHHRRVAALLDADRVAIVGVIAAEILRGCRTAAEVEEVEAALRGVHRLEIAFARWMEIGRELQELRRQGVTVSLTDAAIAHVGRATRSPVYSLDRDFDRFPALPRYP